MVDYILILYYIKNLFQIHLDLIHMHGIYLNLIHVMDKDVFVLFIIQYVTKIDLKILYFFFVAS
jgi:hypothetical protein